jgi:peptidoglycan/xylan/chitin deacetylase (PgdA/CDA1 family)
MYPTRIPRLVSGLLTGFLWHKAREGKDLFLTFDDGPIAELTPWVLDTLKVFDAKATFFCIGRNAEAEPEIMARIRAEGHTVGDHTWDHPRGGVTSTRSYLRNVLRSQARTGGTYFRPPYGSITLTQYLALRKRFKLVMWDVLSGDFDTRIDGPKCLERVLLAAKPGSIIVFHDSLKAEERLRYALPRTLEYFKGEGYRFRAL